MSGLYGTFKTNAKQETEGKWFELSGVINDDKTVPAFKMRRMSRNNPEYQAAIERVSKDIKQAVDLDTLTDDMATPIMRKVFIDTVLVDWRNVYSQHGDKLEYNDSMAETLFSELPDLYLLLVQEAQKIGNFRDAQIEEVSKKSPQSSSKPSGTANT